MKRISTAGVVIKDNSVLLALRKPGTSIGESWEFPGGKLEPGETPQQGLVREFKEEFNLEVEIGDLLHESFFNNKQTEYMLMAFEVCILGGDMDHPEHQETRWVAFNQLPFMAMAPSDRAIADTLMEHAGTS